MDKRRLSKFLSLILRHKPQLAGVKLDARGCCYIPELLEKASKAMKYLRNILA